jgi:N-acetylglucosaminyldiphosphoundecaprenol N-acetyl-beta-D-mannosaminyltransferase
MKRDIPTVTVYGIPVSKMNMQETVEYLSNAVADRRPHQVITANPIMVMAALQRPDYMEMMSKADLVVPDGAGLVWAARYIGHPVAERVTGYDLLHKLMKAGNERRWRIYLLGTTRETIRLAAENLQKKYPNIVIAGFRDGFFSSEEDRDVIAEIRKTEPDLLFVGRSVDTQEPWIARHRSELNIPVMMGIGGSFDVLAGKLKRAPLVFQKMRLEWFYRLLQEPWRYKRMLALPKFAFKVIRDKEQLQKQ